MFVSNFVVISNFFVRVKIPHHDKKPEKSVAKSEFLRQKANSLSPNILTAAFAKTAALERTAAICSVML